MTNNEQQQTADLELDEEKGDTKYNKFQWFLFVIIIPFLFAIAIALVVMTIAGINVFEMVDEYSHKVSKVTSLIKNEEVSSDDAETVFTLRATIEDQKTEIANLQGEIDSKQTEIVASQEEIEKLTNEIKILQEKEKQATIKLEELAKVYETMSSKKSSAILAAMANEDALDIISTMNNTARAAVLEKMEPVKAAELTVLLKSVDEKLLAEQAKESDKQQAP